MIEQHKIYDLEDRTFQFAKDVRAFIKIIPRSLANIEDSKQLIRSSGSVGANYIEANECLGTKDFAMKIKTSRKEAKESIYWLRLIECLSADSLAMQLQLVQEGTELMLIFAAILKKTST